MHRLIKIRIIRDSDRLEERGCRGLDPLMEAYQTAASFLPAADFFETSQGLVLRLELAGVTAEDIYISLCGPELVVQGERQPLSPKGIRRFMRLEIAFGSFERRFTLPISVDPEGVEARYLDGILEVYLPRKRPQTRQIPVKPSPSDE